MHRGPSLPGFAVKSVSLAKRIQHLPHRRIQNYPPPCSPFADRKSTRLNSSHSQISYAVFCLKKKKTIKLLWRVLGQEQETIQHRALCNIPHHHAARGLRTHLLASHSRLAHLTTTDATSSLH